MEDSVYYGLPFTMKMKYFVLVLCVLFSGVFSKTALKRNADGKSNPLIWFIIQQLNALGARMEKLRDIAHESQKDMISVKRDIKDLKSRFGTFATDKNEQSLDGISSKVIAVANKKKIDHLKEKLDKLDTMANKKKIDHLTERLDRMDTLANKKKIDHLEVKLTTQLEKLNTSKLEKQIEQVISQMKRFDDNHANIGK